VRSLGFDVDEAVNGATALELAQRRKPDLVFMDLVMPVMDGFEAIRRMREEPTLASVKIVALSASAFDTTRARSIRAGCDDFLSKPVRLNEVLNALARAQAHLDPRRARGGWRGAGRRSGRPACAARHGLTRRPAGRCGA
jgi:CheY-like chemotaxis protein